MPTNDIIEKAFATRGIVISVEENPTNRIATTVFTILNRVTQSRYNGTAHKIMPATAMNDSWNEISKRRWVSNASITKAVAAKTLTLTYSRNEASDSCNTENIIAARIALGELPHNHT